MSEKPSNEVMAILNDAICDLTAALASAFAEIVRMLDELAPVLIERDRRRAKVKQLRRDFVRKRGLRR